MTCLRDQAAEGRRGTFQCSEEGCEFRRFENGRTEGVVAETPTHNCLLQLRLRAGDVEGAPEHPERWAKGRIWDGEKYVDVEFELTEAQHQLLARGRIGHFSIGHDGIYRLERKDGTMSDNKIEWDIDNNLPLYTRDYLKYRWSHRCRYLGDEEIIFDNIIGRCWLCGARRKD